MSVGSAVNAAGYQDDLRYIAREKSSYLASVVRSTMVANLAAPVLSLILFWGDADPLRLGIWLAYMALASAFRAFVAMRLEPEPERIANPLGNLRLTTWCVGLIGVGWGLGWIVVVPELDMVNRLIYLYVCTGAMFSSMFGYGVHRPTFLAMCVPIFVPAIASAFWPHYGFPWPFSVGVATLFISVLGISSRFAATYEASLRLRLRNESLYQELVTERDASVAANLAKSRFIASASHDLRQPMHAVNFYLESMDLDDLPPDTRRVIGKIRSSITNLNQMFESLLDVSKLDAFTFHAEREPFALARLAQSLQEVGEPLALASGIVFEVKVEAAWVLGDEKLLRQVLLNLISNAISYTPKGRVDVVLREQHGWLVAEVQDTGCGIAESDLGLIFTEFYRVSSSRSRHDGLGLGLSIVQRLCDLIGARIEVESVLGQGSTFRVVTAYPVSLQPVTVDASVPAAAADSRDLLAGKTVAVVEDDANIGEAYRQALAQRGAQVIVLPDEPSDMAQALAEINEVDFIISDFRLTHTTGDVVIQQLRENFNRDIPALIVTADTSPSHISFFRELNVPVLHKPISFQRVIDAMEGLLQAHPAA